MITSEQIQERIARLTAEETALRNSHDNMVKDHQQRTQKVQEAMNANVNRMHQIIGAITTLKELLNGADKPKENEPT